MLTARITSSGAVWSQQKQGPGFDLSRWQRFPSMGVPQTGWVVMETPIENGWFGGTPIQEPLNCNWILVPCIALKAYFWSKNIKIGMVSLQESEQDGYQIRTLPGRSVKTSSLRKHQDQYRKKLETLFKAADVTNDGFLELVSWHISYLGRAFLS